MSKILLTKELDLKQEALRFYSDETPRYKLTVAIPAVAGKIALDEVLDTAMQELYDNRGCATTFARSYGKLRVGINTGSLAAKAALRDAGQPDGQFIELSTVTPALLQEVFSYPDIDGELAFVMDDGMALTEMQLVKALHMIDAGIVTGQFAESDGSSNVGSCILRKPSVVTVSTEELLKIRVDNPQLMLRSYGNVRGLDGAPLLLGMVMPTNVLERSGVSFSTFERATLPGEVPRPLIREKITLPQDRESIIGITTAKTPHAGHLALLMKAFSVASGRKVFVELNDSGPRVAAAVAILADSLYLEVSQVTEMIKGGEISRAQIEQAYQQRSEALTIPTLDDDFELTGSNDYYRELLARIRPDGASIEGLPDRSMLTDTISSVLFDGSVSAVAGEAGAVITRMAGKLTAKGLFLGMLEARPQMTLVDSPPLFTRPEQSTIAQNGVEISTVDGACLMLDFVVASGTAGNSPSLERCIEAVAQEGLEPSRLLEAFRGVCGKAILIKTPEGSLALNMRDADVLLERLAEEARLMVDEETKLDVCAPLNPKQARTVLVRELAAIFGLGDGQRLSLDNIRKIITKVPGLVECLSPDLKSIVQSDAVTMPKTVKTTSDADLLGGLCSGKSKSILRAIEAQKVYDEQFGTDICAQLLYGTELETRLRYMGYEATNLQALEVVLGDKTKTTLGGFVL